MLNTEWLKLMFLLPYCRVTLDWLITGGRKPMPLRFPTFGNNCQSSLSSRIIWSFYVLRNCTKKVQKNIDECMQFFSHLFNIVLKKLKQLKHKS